MNRPFFSIVMPVYNVQAYIEKAIESVCAQTFKEWQLIIVDDCTPDKSIEIAETYACADERIRIVTHKENRGVGAARNSGQKEAAGEYIWFMDPDDYVDNDLLAYVYASLQKNRAQIVVFGHLEEYYDRAGAFGYTHKIVPEEHYFSAEAELRPYVITLEQETLYGYPWNKIYQLSYLREIHLEYEDVKLIEDIVFNINFCKDITSMNTLAIAPYHYAKRLESNLTNKFVPHYYKLHKRRVEMLFEQYNYWGICTKEIREVLGSLYARYILSTLQRNCDKRAHMNYRERYRQCEAIFSESLFCEIMPYAKAKNSRALSIFLRFLKQKRIRLCLCMGRAVHFISNRLPFLYSKVKSER